MRLALLQTNPGEDKARNHEKVARLAQEASGEGAEVLVLPEFFSFMGSDEFKLGSADALSEGSFAFLTRLAQELGLHIIGGSTGERTNDPKMGDPGKLFNTHVSIDPQGSIINIYRKAHLFNLNDPSGRREFRESDWCNPGEPPKGIFSIELSQTTWLALTLICYDLRFPEIFRGSGWAAHPPDVIFLPAAFTHRTGQAHWKVLLRSRAIENQCFVVACNQTGTFCGGKRNFGHSLVVDPWGEVLLEMSEEEGLGLCDIDFSRIKDVRDQIPALANRVLQS